ncbi:hypothetical protein AMAG_18518 [Allomyces macrogynus ATCC 38327]|uniref:Uncharacterized protein n=1 Tax=Allomyces macrogynus (strain ATCC 38327) TaxID=578462 RepID=A0A0L0SCT2_ALLM3|nr:hypothetical protein AMAG_18518 [Allomyces macrogynus ATCC 38327]|eukprot:KNE60353.1 hypothetical protein AMAG_18518 [Allomyces macrogynus ATCC 38327]
MPHSTAPPAAAVHGSTERRQFPSHPRVVDTRGDDSDDQGERLPMPLPTLPRAPRGGAAINTPVGPSRLPSMLSLATAVTRSPSPARGVGHDYASLARASLDRRQSAPVLRRVAWRSQYTPYPTAQTPQYPSTSASRTPQYASVPYPSSAASTPQYPTSTSALATPHPPPSHPRMAIPPPSRIASHAPPSSSIPVLAPLRPDSASSSSTLNHHNPTPPPSQPPAHWTPSRRGSITDLPPVTALHAPPRTVSKRTSAQVLRPAAPVGPGESPLRRRASVAHLGAAYHAVERTDPKQYAYRAQQTAHAQQVAAAESGRGSGSGRMARCRR